MAHNVFISYAHQDKATADAVCTTLEERGIRCWIAPRDIRPGVDWGESIVAAIERCAVMVLVFSGHANESHQIKREVERAVNRGVAILPLRLQDILPSRSLEYFLSTPHWLDAMTPPLEVHLDRLARAVRALLRQHDGAETGVLFDSAPESPLAVAAMELLSAGDTKAARAAPSPPGPSPGVAETQLVQAAVPQVEALPPLPPIPAAAGLPPLPPLSDRAGGARQSDWRRRLVGLASQPLGWLLGAALLLLLLWPLAAAFRGAREPSVGAGQAAVPGPPLRPSEAAPVAAEPRYRETYDCRRGAEFHVSPDEAVVTVNGTTIGIADDWDNRGGGKVYRFPGAGTYAVRFTLRGYRTDWVKINLRPDAEAAICYVEFDLVKGR